MSSAREENSNCEKCGGQLFPGMGHYCPRDVMEREALAQARKEVGTLHDQFTMAVLTGLCAQLNERSSLNYQIAGEALDIADAVMKKRDKSNGMISTEEAERLVLAERDRCAKAVLDYEWEYDETGRELPNIVADIRRGR